MFDTHIHKRTEYTPYEKTVVEKRAPTDESIRIYEEIKEKAYSSIIDSIQVNDNKVNFKCIIYRDMYTFSYYVYYLLSINGGKLENKIAVPENITRDRHEIKREVYNDIAKQLSIYLLKFAEMRNE